MGHIGRRPSAVDPGYRPSGSGADKRQAPANQPVMTLLRANYYLIRTMLNSMLVTGLVTRKD